MTGAENYSPFSLGKLLGGKLQEEIEFRGETTFVILPADLREVAKFCKEELSFDYLLDISSVDNFGDEPRFEIVYELYSMTLAIHLRLKIARLGGCTARCRPSPIFGRRPTGTSGRFST